AHARSVGVPHDGRRVERPPCIAQTARGSASRMNHDDRRRLKVCFVIPSLAGGGAERVAVQILNALDHERWDRSMFLFEATGPFVADVLPAIRLESAAAGSRLARWRALRRFIRRTRPDVIV